MHPGSRRAGVPPALAVLAVVLAGATGFLLRGLPAPPLTAIPGRPLSHRAAGTAPPAEGSRAGGGGATFGGLCGAVPSVQEALDGTDLFRDNLEPDLAPWAARGFSLQDVLDTRAALAADNDHPDLHFLVETRNNSLRLLDREGGVCAPGACSEMWRQLVEALGAGAASGRLRLPDTTFIVDVGDDAVCAPGRCAAPVLSVNRRDGLEDVLVPLFHVPFQVHSAPWARKRAGAFFRGTPFCNGVEHYIAGRLVNCSRLVLSELSAAHPALLNVSISEAFTWEGRTWEALEGPPTPPADHALYQSVLNLDGYAASSRLGLLLATNSVVLKQESVFVEHYYRSLRPCVHFLPIWREAEEDVLRAAAAVAADPDAAQAVAANAQAFALLHLNDDAKLHYWEEALRRYDALMRRPPGGEAKGRGRGRGTRRRKRERGGDQPA
jgi:hypothetical protein